MTEQYQLADKNRFARDVREPTITNESPHPKSGIRCSPALPVGSTGGKDNPPEPLYLSGASPQQQHCHYDGRCDYPKCEFDITPGPLPKLHLD